MIFLDTETYSATPIKHGTYRYAADCEVMVVTWAIDDGPVQCWDATAEKMPDELEYLLRDDDDTLCAHNAIFDRNVLRLSSNVKIDTDIERWRCAMVKAYMHSLPGKLELLGDILNLPQDKRKMKDGDQLMHFFSKPRPATSKIERATGKTHPLEWARFLNYAKNDVEALRLVWNKLPEWNYNGRELALWHLDQRINDRGLAVDTVFATAAVQAIARAQKSLAKRTSDLTDDEVQAATQRDKLIAHILAEYGVGLPDMKSSTLERRIRDPDLPEPVRELLMIRMQSAMSSASKYKTLLRGVSDDGRLRGTLQFAGALRTNRWAGRMFQPQNLMRVPKYLKKQYDFAIESIMADSEDLIYDNPMEVISATVRGAIIAPPGRKLVIADLSNIEGRMLAWLAGEQWKVEAFAAGEDLYVVGYARSFGVTEAEVNEDTEAGGTMRLVGKVEELALGYQGAVGAFKSMAEIYGVNLETEQVVRIVKAWRKANSRIVKFWYGLENTARRAVLKPGVTFECQGLKVRRDGAWLRIGLPSGRALCYPQPTLEDDKISYMGIDQYTRKWTRLYTYGGKLVENVTQAATRDVLGYNMPAVEAAGYDMVATVHDECLTETPDTNEYSAAGLVRLMSAVPPWAEGLPLAAAGYETTRYRKD